MTFKFPAAKKIAVLLAAAAVVVVGLETTQANAQARRYQDTNSTNYGPNGPNSSYQQGPTRIYVTKRSWLDAGTEVLPGERKFQDYAFPQGTSFGQQNLNRNLDRQPMNPASDLGGYPQRFPLY